MCLLGGNGSEYIDGFGVPDRGVPEGVYMYAYSLYAKPYWSSTACGLVEGVRASI